MFLVPVLRFLFVLSAIYWINADVMHTLISKGTFKFVTMPIIRGRMCVYFGYLKII